MSSEHLQDRSLIEAFPLDRRCAGQQFVEQHAKMWKRPYGPTITAHEQATAETKWQTLGELKIAIVSKFEQVVEQVIKDLGVLEEIRKAGK